MARIHRTEQPYPAIDLFDDDAKSHVEIAPWRGGLLTRFDIDGTPILFLDEISLLDTAKNVRGGAPVLFPAPGKLDRDRWSREARSGSMKQHGFARNVAWEVVSTAADHGASATLRLASDDATRAQYPWDFSLVMTFVLRGNKVRIGQRVTNDGSDPMPFGAGFHPYFVVPDADKGKARIPTAARKAFDNVTKSDVDLVDGVIDLTANEVDLHLHGHEASSATLERPGASTIEIACSPEFTRWVVWTLAGKDFVCLEPWTCPGNALNTGEDLIVLAPGATRSLWVEISAR